MKSAEGPSLIRNMPRIAIDGTIFTPKPKEASRYLRNLLAEIAKIDQANEYHVFIDKRVGSSMLPQQKNFLYRPVNFRTNLHWKLFQFRQVRKPNLLSRCSE
jgi:hypothetical protein